MAAVAGGIEPIIPLLLMCTVGATVFRAGFPFRTIIVCAFATLLGFITFNHPDLVSSEWSMVPLLSGLFMAPVAEGILNTKRVKAVPPPQENLWVVGGEHEVKGSLIGCLTGFLAGIGSSSLVALIRRRETEEEDYLATASAAEAGNAMFALLAFALIGSTRSGSAVALAQVAPEVDAIGALMAVGFLGIGVFGGHLLLNTVHHPYRVIIGLIPQKLLALALLLGTLWLVFAYTGQLGITIFACAWILGGVARDWHTPNQALMTTLIGPVIIYYMGWSAGLAELMGLMR